MRFTELEMSETPQVVTLVTQAPTRGHQSSAISQEMSDFDKFVLTASASQKNMRKIADKQIGSNNNKRTTSIPRKTKRNSSLKQTIQSQSDINEIDPKLG